VFGGDVEVIVPLLVDAVEHGLVDVDHLEVAVEDHLSLDGYEAQNCPTLLGRGLCHDVLVVERHVCVYQHPLVAPSRTRTILHLTCRICQSSFPGNF